MPLTRRALLAAVLDHLGLAQATLVGHSMGGRIAWQFAAREPQRVRALVLVAPDGFASPGFEYGKAPEVGPVAKLMQYALPRVVLRWSLEPAYADPAQMTDERATRYHELLLAPGVRPGLIDRMRQLVLQPPEPWLARITAPTLVVHGALDYRVPDAQGLAYYNTLKARGVDARLVWFPDENHWILKPRNSKLRYGEFFDWLAEHGAHSARRKKPRG